ncbi:MAG: endonuclease/exonuclease/phosphatase family protein [Chloroflexi bacterium]|nr:endonuclease/exonuclease/phosphatase family protein [Chloroflexota bacterium]MCC6895495.1 endonuclease/exonuclease/phosphatase family protein [Anaerolineae bacterium]
MNETPAPQTSIFTRLINILALGYLLLMAVYMLLRLVAGDEQPKLSLLNSFAHFTFLPLVPLLLLALLARSRLALLRLLPVLLLLLVWIGPRFIPKPVPAAASDKTIRVATLNVWGNRHDISGTEAWLRETGADIIALEEVSPAYASERLTGLADRYPYQSNQHDETRFGDNFTLSRYPIVSTEFVELGLPDTPAPVRTVIAIDGQQVAMYTVHLAWPVDDEAITVGGLEFYVQVALAFDDTLRNQQIDRLLAHLADEPLPYILAGDFNTSDFSVTYNQLAGAMHDSFAQAGSGLGGSWPVARARGLPAWLPPLIRIDYIWHSDGLRTVRAWQGEAVGSDHLPLLADLALE